MVVVVREMEQDGGSGEEAGVVVEVREHGLWRCIEVCGRFVASDQTVVLW